MGLEPQAVGGSLDFLGGGAPGRRRQNEADRLLVDRRGPGSLTSKMAAARRDRVCVASGCLQPRGLNQVVGDSEGGRCASSGRV